MVRTAPPRSIVPLSDAVLEPVPPPNVTPPASVSVPVPVVTVGPAAPTANVSPPRVWLNPLRSNVPLPTVTAEPAARALLDPRLTVPAVTLRPPVKVPGPARVRVYPPALVSDPAPVTPPVRSSCPVPVPPAVRLLVSVTGT